MVVKVAKIYPARGAIFPKYGMTSEMPQHSLYIDLGIGA